VTFPSRRLCFLLAAALCASPLEAQENPGIQAIHEFKKLTVQELMDIEVTSVSRNVEHLGGAPAAVVVVTSEDIRRTGATTVPDALRLLPGINIARQASSLWAVSSRGFSSVNSEKLLVLSDTRSIYTPLYSGVFWDVQDYLLQDVDRIEVIRGPGATLWGSNAVNGVINITTKAAKNTQGAYVETSAGTEEHGNVGVRYGGRIGQRAYYRIFGKYFDRDATFSRNLASPDEWDAGRLGFRSDWEATTKDTLTVQGDAYNADIGRLSPSVTVSGRPGPPPPLRVHAAGGNVLARWQHKTSEQADVELRAYYDRTHRNDPSFVDDLDTVDLDFQHRLTLAARHEITWGLNYRRMDNRNQSRGVFALDPASSRDRLYSGFVQEQFAVTPELRVTVGTKLEHNDFSGAELQPSGRVAWDFTGRQTLWGAVSRASRVPTRIERDISVDVTNPLGNPVVRLLGNPDFDSERLIAYEMGYRWEPLRSLSMDLAGFNNRYHRLASLEFGVPFADPAARRTVIPIQNQNLNAGRALGGEAYITYTPVRVSRFSFSYSNLDLNLTAGGQDLNRDTFLDGATPRHQLGLRSSFDLPAQFQADAMWRSLSRLHRLPSIVTGEGIPGYSELDLRLAWIGLQRAEFSVIGQNLLHGHHPEFGAPAARGEIERSVYVKVAWGF
jgi:iron complex outermembrane recepter protein